MRQLQLCSSSLQHCSQSVPRKQESPGHRDAAIEFFSASKLRVSAHSSPALDTFHLCTPLTFKIMSQRGGLRPAGPFDAHPPWSCTAHLMEHSLSPAAAPYPQNLSFPFLLRVLPFPATAPSALPPSQGQQEGSGRSPQAAGRHSPAPASPKACLLWSPGLFLQIPAPRTYF